MTNLYTKRIIFLLLMLISLLSGFLFLATNNLDFLITAINQGQLNIPNIAYILARSVSTILLPFIFVVPPLFRYARVLCSKIVFIVYGALMILTSVWIFYFIGSHPFSQLFSNTAITEFQADTSSAFVASYVFWGTYSWAGTLFSLIFGGLCIWTGISFDDNRKKVRFLITALLAVQIVLPIITCLIAGNGILSSFWLVNNYLCVVSAAAYTAGIWLATTDDASWINLAWEEEFIDNDYDDIPEISDENI